ncbi:MAG: SpoIVB peptidase [Oscillospiraceae bacterium]|nr:SpoIVB peptidase [Oscillospiraceae bacterium]
MWNFKRNFSFLLILVILTPAFSLIYAFVDISVFQPADIYSSETIAVSAEERRVVIPLGTAIGVDINMEGLLVVEVSDMVTAGNQTRAPARDAGIKPGDNIVRINGEEVQSVEEINEIINDSDADDSEPLEVEVMRGDETLNLTIAPEMCRDSGDFRIAAWVKDSTSGIGTLTFYDPENSTFGALGHGITGKGGAPVNIAGGSILNSTVVSVRPSERGQIGELRGIFLERDRQIGEIKINNEQGLYGTLDKEMLDLDDAREMSVAQKSEIRVGNAQILSNIESVRVEKFDIEIQRIMRNTSDNTKEMVIRITDEYLLSRVGGIVQGMSGSPIIQNDNIVGAVTHVFVNDPTRGYGISIESMLDSAYTR